LEQAEAPTATRINEADIGLRRPSHPPRSSTIT
jgi:hypothetical protein